MPRICNTLEPTNFEFVDEPLLDVVDYLKDLHNIEIQIDAKALEAASIGTDMPVTCNLKGIALRPALDLMLKQLKLAYFIEGEVLMITNEQPSEPRLSVRLYDCSWFVKPNQLPKVIEVLELMQNGRRGHPTPGRINSATTTPRRPLRHFGSFLMDPGWRCGPAMSSTKRFAACWPNCAAQPNPMQRQPRIKLTNPPCRQERGLKASTLL